VIVVLANVSVSRALLERNATSVTGAPLATYHIASHAENALTTGIGSSPNLLVRLSLILHCYDNSYNIGNTDTTRDVTKLVKIRNRRMRILTFIIRRMRMRIVAFI